ncbi:MAG: formylglycine-generating enzyme family protein [Prevotella sp.]
MSDVVVAWKKGLWGRKRIYPEIDSKLYLGLIRLFDSDKNEQIFVHREGEKIHYVYLWKLSKFDYISLGLLTNKLCLDYYDLLRMFRAFVKDMAVNKLCVYNTKRGKIKLSSHNIKKQPRQRTLLDINIKNLKAQFDEKQKKWNNLPSQKLGILKSDIVPCTLEIQGSSWIVTQVTSGYRNVCISVRDENKPKIKNGRNKESGIASSIKSLQFLPKLSNSGKTAKTLRSLNTTNWSNGGKEEKKHIDLVEIFAASVIVVGIISVLLSCIAPWFISTMQMWLKIALATVSCFGVYLITYATDDNHKGKNVVLAGWCGVIAILLSTIITIYGIRGGFSPNKVGEWSKKKTISENSLVSEKERKQIVSKQKPVTRILNSFIRVLSGTYDFYIDKYEVTQKDYVALMGNNPSKYQDGNLPVHGMSVRNAVIYCNKKSEAEGLRGFYKISENAVSLKSDGNGYRLPTEEEWILASKNTKENANEYPIRPYPQNVKRYDFKPHAVGEIPDRRRELFDVYGNVSELCVRSNGEIWGKGGSYRIALATEASENGGLKAAEDLSSTIPLNADFGLRLVFIP